MKNLLFVFSFFALFVYCKPKPTVLDDEALLSYAKSADKDLIERHIAVLANDSLRGRLPGTPEYDIAMKYIVDQYQSMGITPLGNQEGSSYFQTLTIRNSLIDEGNSFLLLGNNDTLIVGTDYFYLGNSSEPEVEFEGELVFGGFGIDASDFGFNDFEDLDVKGKIRRD